MPIGHLDRKPISLSAWQHLASSRDGAIAVIATGVRGPTTLDKRTVGKRGQTLLIQFERD